MNGGRLPSRHAMPPYIPLTCSENHKSRIVGPEEGSLLLGMCMEIAPSTELVSDREAYVIRTSACRAGRYILLC